MNAALNDAAAPTAQPEADALRLLLVLPAAFLALAAVAPFLSDYALVHFRFKVQ